MPSRPGWQRRRAGGNRPEGWRARLAACFFAAAALPVDGAVADTAGTLLRVTVTNVTEPGGTLLVGVYDRADNWLGVPPYRSIEVPVAANRKGNDVTLELRLPPGEYALSLFQDMNGNRRLDTNFLGIPQEASGSSNNPPTRWGPPKFRDALVTVGDAPLDLSIRLN
jgi:uncharacterized protein (DUF2141 family)